MTISFLPDSSNDTNVPEVPYDVRSVKICAVLSSRLDITTAINTIGHMAVAIGLALGPEVGLLGRTHTDASGVAHGRLARYPFITLAARPGKLRELVATARQTLGVTLVDYPEEGFTTTHDDDYAAAITNKKETDINYIGMLLIGPATAVNPITGKLSFWRPLELAATA